MNKIFLPVIFAFLISCGNSVEFKESPISGFEGQFAVTDLTFENIKTDILAPHCIQCHPAYSDYDVIFKDKDKVLNAVLTETMPKNMPAVSTELKVMLDLWVKNGAPYGERERENENVGLKPTWNSLSKNIFFTKCTQCHNPLGEASYIDLSSRKSIFEQRNYLLNNFENIEESILIDVISDINEPMPPLYSGLSRLTPEEISVVKEWIKLGLP